MQGELGGKIKIIEIGRPSTDLKGNVINDLKIQEKNGEFLWIIGDNDMEKLLENALENYRAKYKGDSNVGF